MRRRRKVSHSNHDRWLVSYADFITLLFAFFVVMYSSSQVDHRKVGKLATAIQVAFQQLGVFPAATTQSPIDPKRLDQYKVQAIGNGECEPRLLKAISSRSPASDSSEKYDLQQLRGELQSVLAPEIARNQVALREIPDGLVISLREIGFFDSGSAQLKTSSLPAFDRIVSVLRQRRHRLRIEGHSDNVPIHTAQFRSNWELSTARATELVQLLIQRYRFAPELLGAAGYGEFHPITSNDTAEGRAQNRRVDIVVLGDAAERH